MSYSFLLGFVNIFPTIPEYILAHLSLDILQIYDNKNIFFKRYYPISLQYYKSNIYSVTCMQYKYFIFSKRSRWRRWRKNGQARRKMYFSFYMFNWSKTYLGNCIVNIRYCTKYLKLGVTKVIIGKNTWSVLSH